MPESQILEARNAHILLLRLVVQVPLTHDVVLR